MRATGPPPPPGGGGPGTGVLPGGSGRWLSRDPIGEPGFETIRKSSEVPKVGKVVSDASFPQARLFVRAVILKNQENRYAFVNNDTKSKIDFLGLSHSSTFYSWTASPCGNGAETAFMQVGLGGGTL